MTFSRPLINQSACAIYLCHIIINFTVNFISFVYVAVNMAPVSYRGVTRVLMLRECAHFMPDEKTRLKGYKGRGR